MSMRSRRTRYTFSLKRKFPRLALIICVLIGLPFLSLQVGGRLYLNQGQQLEAEGKRQEAIAAYQTALKFQPNFSKIHLYLGESLQEDAQYLEAFAAYNRAFIINPKLASAHPNIVLKLNDLGKFLVAEGQLEEAIITYQRAIFVDSFAVESYYNLGEILARQGREEQAIEAFNKAIQFDSNFVPAYLSLGNIFNEQEQWNQASQAYEKALKIEPLNLEIYKKLGKVKQEQGRFNQAEKLYLQALSIESNNSDLYNQLGEVLFQQRRINEAIAAYEQALKINPQEGLIYKNLCYAYHSQKQIEKAIQLCKKAYKLDPTQGGAKFYFQEIERALAFHQNPELSRAKEILPSEKNDPLVTVKRSIIKIVVNSPNYHSVGTGWLVKRSGNQGFILTNRHVIIPPKQKQNSQAKIEVEFYSQPPRGQFRKRETAKILHKTKADEWLDLALLKVDNIPVDITPLPLIPTSMFPGTPIKIIGHPVTDEDWSVISGEVYNSTPQELLLSVMLASGNSGGPVLNKENQVVGVIVKAGLYCSNPTALKEIDLSINSLGCGLAFPSQVIQQQLQDWKLEIDTKN